MICAPATLAWDPRYYRVSLRRERRLWKLLRCEKARVNHIELGAARLVVQDYLITSLKLRGKQTHPTT